MKSNTDKVLATMGIAIETDAAILQREAQQAQADWFADPNGIGRKEEYGKTLLRWAKETGNKRAAEFASSLLS